MCRMCLTLGFLVVCVETGLVPNKYMPVPVTVLLVNSHCVICNCFVFVS